LRQVFARILADVEAHDRGIRRFAHLALGAGDRLVVPDGRRAITPVRGDVAEGEAEILKLWHQGHFLNFNGLTRLVTLLWPFAAIGYLIVLAARRRDEALL
jgi:hypothetical protein